jgi:hypothetical protein
MSNFEFTFAHHGYGKGNVGREAVVFQQSNLGGNATVPAAVAGMSHFV